MIRVIEIFVVIVIIFLILGLVTMPWPANLILGSIAIVSVVTAVISSKQAKKREEKREQNDKTYR